MDKVEIVKTAFNFDTPNEVAESYIDEEFQSTDQLGSPPLDKAAWFAMGELMRASIPDVDYIIEEIRPDGEEVVLTGHFSGTFTNDMDLSALGAGTIPASGKAVEFPKSTVRVSFKGDKIVRSHDVTTGPDAGMPGFLKALGAKVG